MNATKMKNIQQIISCLFILQLISCSNIDENKGNPDSLITVEINIDGVEIAADDSSTIRSGVDSFSNTQEFIIPFDEQIAAYATLTDEITTNNSEENLTRVSNVSALENNIRYGVVVYNVQGKQVYKETCTYPSSVAIDHLHEGESYTFIVYSVNSTTSLPDIQGSTLSEAMLNNVSEDLMFSKQTICLQLGDNNIKVTLKHKFSLITSKLSVDPTIGGAITSFIPPVIKPTCTSANLCLSDESLTYNSVKSGGTKVVFGDLGKGVGSITSTPTLLINPATSSGTYEIGSITVNNSTNNVTLSNVKIIPGHKYNLNLNFKIPCTQDVGTNGIFNVDASKKRQTIDAPGADYGFVFDIYYLDNSFNMEINGTKLATTELQFERNYSALPQNVKFKDGSYCEDGNVPDIWKLNRANSKSPTEAVVNLPVIRLVISKDGVVSMYGVKKNPAEDPTLYPLVLDTSKTRFNTITWNKSGDNKVVISQTNINVTQMIGYGYGKKIVKCN